MASENCIISIRNRKCHNVRFYKILNVLSDLDIEWKFFRETLKFLCVPEMEEIVEERNSKNKCGYVLCNNSITMHPTAIYSLNISKRKIFNISNRKKYCSHWCYGAFKHICNQIPSEPLWKNKDKTIDKMFTIYSKSAAGCEGELYFDEDLDLEKNLEDIPSDKIAPNVFQESQHQCLPKEILVQNKITKKQENKKNDSVEKQSKQAKIEQNVINSLDKLTISKKKTLDEVINKIKTNAANNTERKLKFIDEYLNDSDMVLIPSDEESLNLLLKIKFIVSGWITENTRDFICDCPNRNDSDEDCDDQSNIYDKITDDEECERNMLLPVLDSEDQKTIRRNILIKKAKMACVPILGDFGIESNYFLGEFEKFICTCRLTAKNISFSSKEFKWLIIVIVDILSCKFGKVADDKKAFILKKHGLSQRLLYEGVLKEIKSYIYQPIKVSVSPQGDSTECK